MGCLPCHIRWINILFKRENEMNTRENKTTLIIAVVLILTALAMGIVSWFILPDWVLVQFPELQTGAPQLPKIVAVLFPFALSTVFAVLSRKESQAAKYALLGLVFYILLWICN